MVATTFRADLRAGCYAILAAVKAASPTLLPDISPSPPESYSTPMGFVEKRVRETTTHTAQTRTRTLEAGIVIVNKLMSNDQATSEQDVLVDLVVDACTAAPNAAGAATLIEPVSVLDFELQGGDGIRYSAVRIGVRGTIREGRS